MARAKKKQKQDEQAVTDENPVVTETAIEDAGIGVLAQETEEADVHAELADEAVTETAEAAPEASAETVSEDGVALEITQSDIRLVEAILFATASALTVSMIAERFPAERAKLIPDILEQLKGQYEGRGVTLVQRDSRWAFRTATDLAAQLRLEKEQPKKFTRSAMETMAVVAYHQPVTRAEIENIRGVATSPGALDALMEAGWIKPGKRREVPGRPVTWLSTQGFLDHFGLEKLEDLPGMDELKAAGLLDKRPAIEAMPTADLFGDDENRPDHIQNEITDEDLLGKPGEEEGAHASNERSENAEEGSHDAEEETDGEDLDDEDLEDMDEEASDEEDSDEEDFDDEDEDDEDDEDGDDEE